MGQSFAKTSTSSGAKCSTCNQAHCCYKNCYWSPAKATAYRKALTKALKQRHVEYVLEIVMEYIGSLQVITEMKSAHSHEGYHAFTHAVLSEVYQRDGCKHSPFKNLDSLYQLDTQSVRYNHSGGPIPECKIVVLGHGGIGKSALVIRLVTDNFLNEYDPTIEDSYRKAVQVDDQQIVLDVLDTAGREEFSSMEDQWIREGEVFLLVFAINSMPTFDEALLKRERILRCKDEAAHVPMILVATKCDLLFDDEYIAANEKAKYPQKFIDREVIVETAQQYQLPYIETSAKYGKNVEFLFKYVYYEQCIQKVMRLHE